MNARERKRDKLRKLRDFSGITISYHLSEILGVSVPVEEYTNAREREIKALETMLINSINPVGKRIFQSLPKHLRRRASSHNTKRLPFGLRPYADIQDEKFAVNARKKKNFRLRKRALNCGLKYLPSHFWQAKRMKMSNLWGFRLSDRPTEKSRTKIYRAYNYNCVLHDGSYNQIITVKVSDALYDAMSRITDETLAPINHKRYTDGNLCGYQILYDPDRFPHDVICPFWFFRTEDEINLSVHPGSYQKVLGLFNNLSINVVPTVHSHMPEYGQFDLCGPESTNIITRAFGIDKKYLNIMKDSEAFVFTIDQAHWELVTPNNEAKPEISQKSTVRSFKDLHKEFKIIIISLKPAMHLMEDSFSGWKVILSSKYARFVWNALTKYNLRVVGQRGLRTKYLEASVPQFPFDWADSVPYMKRANEKMTEILDTQKKYPPSKRNIKRGPFDCPISEKDIRSYFEDMESRWLIKSDRVLEHFKSYYLEGVPSFDFERSLVFCEVFMTGRGIPLTGSPVYTLPPGDYDFHKGLLLSNIDKDTLECIGYVTSGDLSISMACGKAIAVFDCKKISTSKLVPGIKAKIIIENSRTQMFYSAVVKRMLAVKANCAF